VLSTYEEIMQVRKTAKQQKVGVKEIKRARLALLEAKAVCLEQSLRRINP
jgi:hypothetical protein